MSQAIARSIDELIGATPLLELPSPEGGAHILGKLESFNPGGSVKDRIALAMIDEAEKAGLIDADTTIIEPTSGNTGIGLAMVAAARGYRLVIVMPESMSVERRALIQAFGAVLVLTPASEGVPGAARKAEELLASTPNSFGPHQFDNQANPQIHYATTGPEVWEATGGQIAAFVAGVGTGGTVSGAGRFLKEQSADVKVFAVEPEESQVLVGGKPGPHKIQGLAPGFVAATTDLDTIDEILHVTTATALETQKKLATGSGVFAGISSGAAYAAAYEVAQRPEFAGKTIVAILPDTGERYLSMIG